MDTKEAGALGGRSRSERKRAAVRENLAKARLAQARKLLGQPEPQPIPARTPLTIPEPLFDELDQTP